MHLLVAGFRCLAFYCCALLRLALVLAVFAEVLEHALKERAKLDYTEPTIREMAGATKVAAKRLRLALGAAGAVNGAAGRLRRVQEGTRRREYFDPDSNGA